MRAHEGGRLVATGSQLGTLSLLHVPMRLVAPLDRHEKSAFTAVSDWAICEKTIFYFIFDDPGQYEIENYSDLG